MEDARADTVGRERFQTQSLIGVRNNGLYNTKNSPNTDGNGNTNGDGNGNTNGNGNSNGRGYRCWRSVKIKVWENYVITHKNNLPKSCI